MDINKITRDSVSIREKKMPLTQNLEMEISHIHKHEENNIL